MRIAFVTTDYPPGLGGIEVVVEQLARHMVRAGHAVEVLAHTNSNAPAGQEYRDGVLVRRFSVPVPSRDFSISPALLREMVRERKSFDVVHAHNYHAFPALGAALAGMRPLVFSPYYHGGGHGPLARVAHLVYRPLSRVLFRSSARLICASAAEAGALRRDFPDSKLPITVIHNGVASSEFEQAEPFELAETVIVAAGRIEKYKQFERVALAAEFLPEEVKVVILGDGPARDELQTLIAERGLSHRVRLLGRVSSGDLRRWFRTASALATMSRHESFGLTLLEALAARTPVLASDIPAHREIAAAQPPGAIRLVGVDAPPRKVANRLKEALSDGIPPGVVAESWDEVAGKVLITYESVLRPQ